ncbi:MAG: ChrR family anti-sigma-E factor [Cellvibrionaceae bacterium]|nr:ChrR family anti-sigma-E factor [Cellvibrionaceae bacterium]
MSEFVAGSLAPAQAIAVSAHLAYCSQCRQQVKKLETLGGQLLEGLAPANVDAEDFEKLLAHLDQATTDKQHTEASTAHTNAATDPTDKDLPFIINQLLSRQISLQWKSIGTSLKSAHLHTGQITHEVSLHRIAAGGKIAQHDHRGEEITLVMKGSFSDEDGLYQTGDFVLKQPGEVHRPLAAKHEPCLCLVVQQAPIALTGLLTKWINPFLKIHAG